MNKKILIGLFSIVLIFSACQKEPDPETSLRESIAKMAESNQYHFEISFIGKGQDPNGEMVDFSAEVKGSGNTEDKEHPEGDADLTLGITSKDGAMKIGVSLRFLPGYFYAKLNELMLPGEGLPQETTDQFLNTWWEIPIPEENSPFKAAPKEQEEIIAKLKTVSLFQNISKVSEEEVQGELSYKYRADLNPEALVSFLEEATKISNPEKQVTEEEKNALLDALKDVDFSGNLWVSKSDGTLRKVSGTLRSAPKEGGNISLDFEASFWDFGKKVAYEKPEGATPFNPALLLGLFGSLPGLGGAPALEPVPVDGNIPIDNPLGAEQ